MADQELEKEKEKKSYLIENLKSSSTSDNIANVEADPSTFSNKFHHKLNQIQSKLTENTHKWLEYRTIENKSYCFCCRMLVSII